jgi:hypothetical protein
MSKIQVKDMTQALQIHTINGTLRPRIMVRMQVIAAITLHTTIRRLAVLSNHMELMKVRFEVN